MKSVLPKFLVIVIMAGIISGCATPEFTLKPPSAPVSKYDTGQKAPVVLKIVDARTETKFFKGLGGLSSFDIPIKNVPDPIQWLAQAMQTEFSTRGIPATVGGKEITGNPDLVLTIQTYQIRNYRHNAFTPWVSYHMFKGDLLSGGKNIPIQAYFLYGKVPMMSIYEIEEPCLNKPMAIVVKEVVSKINRHSLQHKMSTAKLNEINAGIAKKMVTPSQSSDSKENKTEAPEDVYLSVIELGGSNNPAAMDMLINIAGTEDVFTRACALSAMGTLGAEEKLDLLKNKYAAYTDIDRFMALKAIGDIGSPEAKAFLQNAKADPQNENEYGVSFCVELYAE